MAKKAAAAPEDKLTPLKAEDLDRLSTDTDGNLYLDRKKVVTYDPFEAFKRARPRTKIVSVIVGSVGFLVALSVLVERGLVWNDRYCWYPPLYSVAAACAPVSDSEEEGSQSGSATPGSQETGTTGVEPASGG